MKATVVVAVAAFLAACGGNASEDPRGPDFGLGECRFPPRERVEINGNFYEPLWGPLRSDMVQTEAITPTAMEAQDNRQCPGYVPDNVHEIVDVPVEQMFVEVRDAKNDGGGNAMTPLACHHTNEVYAFTAVGSDESPPPFSRPAPTPADGAGPTPVPTPPTDGPLVELSSQGLLDSGWPHIHLPAPDGRNVTWDNGVRVMYHETEYHLSSYRPLDDYSPRRLSADDLEPVDIIFVRYVEDRWPAGLASSMPFLIGTGQIEDRVRIYRPEDRSAADVIVVDPCPTYPDDLQPDNLMFWGRVQPDAENP